MAVVGPELQADGRVTLTLTTTVRMASVTIATVVLAVLVGVTLSARDSDITEFGVGRQQADAVCTGRLGGANTADAAASTPCESCTTGLDGSGGLYGIGCTPIGLFNLDQQQSLSGQVNLDTPLQVRYVSSTQDSTGILMPTFSVPPSAFQDSVTVASASSYAFALDMDTGLAVLVAGDSAGGFSPNIALDYLPRAFTQRGYSSIVGASSGNGLFQFELRVTPYLLRMVPTSGSSLSLWGLNDTSTVVTRVSNGNVLRFNSSTPEQRLCIRTGPAVKEVFFGRSDFTCLKSTKTGLFAALSQGIATATGVLSLLTIGFNFLSSRRAL